MAPGIPPEVTPEMPLEVSPDMAESDSSRNRLGPPTVRQGEQYLAWFGASAVMLALAFPQPGWWWLAHAALVPAVWAALRSARVSWLLGSSYLIAWAWWLVRLYWLANVTWGGYIAVCAFLALYFPFAMLWTRWLAKSYPRVPLSLIVPMVWVSLEMLRGAWPAGGFGWFSLGHSQAPFWDSQEPGRLIQIADVLSEYGVSFLVAMTNGLGVDWMLHHDATRYGQTSPRHRRTLLLSAAIWLASIGSAWLYGQHRINQAQPSATQTIRVAVVQTNVPQDNKDRPSPEQEMDNWFALVDLTRDTPEPPEGSSKKAPAPEAHPEVTAKAAPELIVWPETVVPAALNRESLLEYESGGAWGKSRIFFHKQLLALSRELGANLLVGAHAYQDWKLVQSDDGRTYRLPQKKYNSVYLYRSDGTAAVARYDKIHRVPFGEYIPWVEDWPWLKKLFIDYLSPYDFDYTLQPGQAWTVFDLRLKPRTAPRSPQQHSDPTDPSQQPAASGPSTNTISQIRLATPICFEDTIGRVCRQMVYSPDGQKRVDLLVNLTNDGWYPGSHQGFQHLQIAVLRCVENRVPMARSVNTGISGFIDSVGRIGPVVQVYNWVQEVEGYATHTVTTDPRLTFFGRMGYLPILAMSAICVLLTLASLIRRH